jgi:four helix bundle protein
MGNFKELRVWQDAVNLAVSVYKMTNEEPFKKDFGLSNQIQRAAVSIASNIAEGEGRESIKENIRFLSIAKGSAAEVITQLIIAYRIGYITKEKFEKAEDFTEKIKATLKQLIKSKRKGL